MRRPGTAPGSISGWEDMIRKYQAILMIAAASIAPAAAAPAQKAPPSDPRIVALQQQLTDIQRQLTEIRARNEGADARTAVAELKRSTTDQVAGINNRLAQQPKVSASNGRFTFASADGDFTLALRAFAQFDMAYFAQGRNPAAVDLNSGTNFRRAQLGIQGTAWRDWSYSFVYDFGGNGVESRGYIYNAYLQYDGAKPFYFRAGAFSPADGLEDQTSHGDLLFLERTQSVDVARNIAASPGREAVSAWYQDERFLAAISYSGKKTTDGTSTGAAVGTFDAQQAVLGRVAWLASNGAIKWLVDGHVSHVLKLADTTASPAATVIRFSNGPEVSVDASRTVDTGNIDATHVTEFGFESGAAYENLYAQGGWFHYGVQRRLAGLPNPDFSGWYVQAAWAPTGEEKAYEAATATFRQLRPAKPLGTPGGYGAFELKARWSSLDLDYLPFSTAATGGVAGGKQDIWALGVNWYPTSGIRFELDYDNIQVNHINLPANDISANAIALRTQISL